MTIVKVIISPWLHCPGILGLFVVASFFMGLELEPVARFLLGLAAALFLAHHVAIIWIAFKTSYFLIIYVLSTTALILSNFGALSAFFDVFSYVIGLSYFATIIGSGFALSKITGKGLGIGWGLLFTLVAFYSIISVWFYAKRLRGQLSTDL